MKKKKERMERKYVMNAGKVRARELQREGNRRRARNGKKKKMSGKSDRKKRGEQTRHCSEAVALK